MKYLKVFTDFAEIIDPLQDAEVGRLFKSMLSYAESGTAPDLRGNERFVWNTAKQIIDREAAYCEKQAENGRKGGRPKNPAKPSKTQINPAKPSESLKDKDKNKEYKETLPNGSAKKAGGAVFHPPTLEQVKAYAKEANLSIDCEKFYAYFTVPNPDTGKTWVDSQGNPVKNWKQKMLTWESKGRPVDRARKNNTLLNYRETGKSHADLETIAFSEEDL